MNKNSFLYDPEEYKSAITEPVRPAPTRKYEPLRIENSIATIAEFHKPKVIFSHFSILRRVWEYALLIISVLPAFEIPFFSIFIYEFSAKIYWPFMILDVIFLLDLYVVLSTSFVSHGVIVSDKKRIFQLYGLKSVIFHIIGSIPACWFGVFFDNKIAYIVLSILKIFRLNRCMIALHTTKSNLVYYSWFSALLPLVICFLFVVHLFACIFYLSAFLSNSTETWINILHWSYLTPPQLYVTSIYFVLTTIFGIGYGDLTPQASCEVMVVIPIQVIGVTTNLLIVAKLVELSLTGPDKSFVRETREFRDYLSFKRIPKNVLEETTNYFQMRYDESKGADEPSQVLKYLPETLRTSLVLDQCRYSMMQVDLFRVASQNFLASISKMLSPRAFIPGETIIKQGEIVPELLMLNSGTIQILVDNIEISRPEFNDGLVFGEIELFLDKPREATIKAVTHVSGWSLTRLQIQMVVAYQADLRREINSIAKMIYPQHVKEIKNIISVQTLENVLKDASDTESSYSDSDLFLGTKIMTSSSDDDTSFELM